MEWCQAARIKGNGGSHPPVAFWRLFLSMLKSSAHCSGIGTNRFSEEQNAQSDSKVSEESLMGLLSFPSDHFVHLGRNLTVVGCLEFPK